MPKAYAGGDGVGVERNVPVDVPEYKFTGKDDFEKEWHIAMWDETARVVWINKEAPVLVESIKYHQDQYADIYAEQVQETVLQVFGEVAVAKLAHSQKLRKFVSDEELRDEYRSEPVLTVALMGLLAERASLRQRLGKFGRKRGRRFVELILSTGRWRSSVATSRSKSKRGARFQARTCR
ncbi:MAG: hypothetical protein IPL06_17730 [Betaproteobacteria bacterium]|nr:hypothetical protein [Betaproteobacteria bacterium]